MSASRYMQAATGRRKELVRFLRELIAIPAESGREEARCRRVLAEYKRLGFDEVRFDALGSVLARVGRGPLTILLDGHIDCVGVGDPGSWRHDPFLGKLENGEVWGRGAVDELPAVACMAHGLRLLLDEGLGDELSVWLCASVLEEDCDGYALRHLIEEEGLRPDAVVLGEPTDLQVYRGHRGRMEIAVTTKGVSAHGAHRDLGVNAIVKLAPIVLEIEELNGRLAHDAFLGKGTVTVSHIDCKTPSLCAVPDQARIWIDRRLTAGETVELALEQIRSLPSIGDALVELPHWDARAWTGREARQEKYFPTWVLPPEHPLVQGTAAAVEAELGAPPRIGRWTFSTNGVATMGRHGIPTVGFAPGREELSHSTEERVAVDDLVRATAAYARIVRELAARRRDLQTGD